jgi:hypothetical protein
MGRGGQRSAPSEAELAGDLSSNPQYAPFCAADFDANEFASQALSGSSTSAQVPFPRSDAGTRGAPV